MLHFSVRKTLFFIFFSLSYSLFAGSDSCNLALTGKVLAVDTKEPIPYASVSVKGTSKFSITDINGEFKIDSLCDKRNILIISCFGYCDSICEHHYQHDYAPYLYLSQKVEEIDAITIKVEVAKTDGTKSLSQVSLGIEELKINPTQSLAEAIENETGMSIVSAGTNVKLPVIHGLYGNRVLILNNGLKHGFQNWGRDHAPEIDISSAKKITIIKGAAGVRFGPDALGGAILVESTPLYLRKPLYAELGTGFQSNGKGYNTTFELGRGGKNWSYFVNGNYAKIGDKHSPQYMLTNTGKEEKSIGVGSRYYNKKWDVKLRYSLVNQNLALLRASFPSSAAAITRAFEADEPDSAYVLPFSYKINEPNQVIQHHLGKAEIKWRYTDDAYLTFVSGRQFNQRLEFDVRRNSNLPIINLNLTTSDYQLEWKHPAWHKMNGLVGLQYYYQDNDNNPGTGTTAFIPNYNTNRYSAFVVESRRIGKSLIELGIRVDIASNNVRGREVSQDVFRDDFLFSNVTSSIGLVRSLTKDISFQTNLGTAWRTPNMSELYSFGQHGYRSSFGLLRYYFDEQKQLKTDEVLKMAESSVVPEKGFKFINELNIRKNKHLHTVVGYAHYMLNFIYERPYTLVGTFRGPQAVFIVEQTDAFLTGIDYSWNSDWTNNIEGTFGVSYLWSRNISDAETLINQPPITISYKLDWNFNFWKFTKSQFIIRPLYRFRQFQSPRTVTPEQIISGEEKITPESEVFDFKSAPEGYFMLNLSWQFEWRFLAGGITINNALNSSYRDYLNDMRYFADAPGTNLLFNLKYKFNFKNKTAKNRKQKN